MSKAKVLPWKWEEAEWEEAESDRWTAQFEVHDDAGNRHEVKVLIEKWHSEDIIVPQDLAEALGLDIGISICASTGASVGVLTKTTEEPLIESSVDFYVDGEIDKNDIEPNLSFFKAVVPLFNTVQDIIQTFVDETDPDILWWSASTMSRAKIYNKMMKRSNSSKYVPFAEGVNGGLAKRSLSKGNFEPF